MLVVDQCLVEGQIVPEFATKARVRIGSSKTINVHTHSNGPNNRQMKNEATSRFHRFHEFRFAFSFHGLSSKSVLVLLLNLHHPIIQNSSLIMRYPLLNFILLSLCVVPVQGFIPTIGIQHSRIQWSTPQVGTRTALAANGKGSASSTIPKSPVERSVLG